jgi:hypothetical protein
MEMALSLPLGIMPVSRNDIEDEWYAAHPNKLITPDAIDQVYEALHRSAHSSYIRALQDPGDIRSILFSIARKILNAAADISGNVVTGAEVEFVI